MSHLLRIDYPNAWQHVINRARRGKDNRSIDLVSAFAIMPESGSRIIPFVAVVPISIPKSSRGMITLMHTVIKTVQVAGILRITAMKSSVRRDLANSLGFHRRSASMVWQATRAPFEGLRRGTSIEQGSEAIGQRG